MTEDGKEHALEQPERVPEKATESEMVLFLFQHIDRPCSTEVSPGVFRDIRRFYIQEARRYMNKMTNEHAKRALELKIAEYEQPDPKPI